MYQQPIFLKPVFHEKIWGGLKLKTDFGYPVPSAKTGEAWVISAHANGQCLVINGDWAGKTLQDIWENHGELFNNEGNNDGAYPLLVKILDANEDLSVQVHPDDQYAQKTEHVPYGKTECWYVLSAEPDAELVMGHYAKTKQALAGMMDNAEWSKLLKRVPVKQGDFYYVPSGTIHAIGKGIVILEIQQSSDVTYRVYDYDRKDANGNKRALHLDHAKNVTTVPHTIGQYHKKLETVNELESVQLIQTAYFTVYHWQLNGMAAMEMNEDFLQVNVIGGKGEICINKTAFSLKKGVHFIIPHGVREFRLKGELELIVSHT